MKLTKKLEKEILEVYNEYWDSYLKGDMKTFASILDNNCHIIGSTEFDIFKDKKSAVKFYSATAEQISGKAAFRNRKISVLPYDDNVMVQELSDFYFLTGDEWHFYGQGRYSTLFEKKEHGWKIIHQHGSLPDARTEEGEQIAAQDIAEENRLLRDAVKRRTIELERKNNELEIETSLEKVRAIAMSMKKPGDLLEVCKILFTELQKLGFRDLRNSMINIHDDEKGSLLNYDFSDFAGAAIATIPYDVHPSVRKMVNRTRKENDAFIDYAFTGKGLNEWMQWRKEIGEYDDPRVEKTNAIYYYFYSIGTGSIGISAFSKIENEKLQLLERFRNVFKLSYQRYIDISHAEAQAKEAEIELALERVRARTMAMQHSEELQDAASIMVRQIQSLGVPQFGSGFNIWDKDKKTATAWMSNITTDHLPPPFKTFSSEDIFSLIHDAAERGESLFVREQAGEELKMHYEYMNSIPIFKEFAESAIPEGFEIPELQIMHCAFFLQGYLMFITYEPVPEAHDIFKRFAKVFEQTYTRFLDLQKVEAQAKEAQIEAALERVRSRTMGMQKSEELKEVIKIVYLQLTHVNINLEHAGFVVDYTPGGDWHFWVADEQDIPSKITHPFFDSVWANQFNNAKEKGAEYFTTNLNFEEKNKFYNELLSYIPGLPEASKEFYLNCPGLAATTVLFDNVSLYIENFEGIAYTDEENKTLMRFGKVFQQTYTRFLDLQKAEAQARESQVQLALERVRAKTMAMHQSAELADTSAVLFQQIKELGFETWSCGFCIWQQHDSVELWMGADSGGLLPPMEISYKEEPTHSKIYESHLKGAVTHEQIWEGAALQEHYTYLRTIPSVAAAIKVLEDSGLSLPARQCYYAGFFKQGYLLLITKEPNEELSELSKQFATVFQQTYTRFRDLQKAEAQVRESQIEAALERTRTQSMIMQHSNELDNTLRVFHEQVLLLGIHSAFSFLWLPDEEQDKHIFWAAWVENNSTDFSSKAIIYPLDRNEPATAQCLIDWKGNEPVVSYHVPPAGVKSYFAAWQELIAGVEKLKPEYFSEGLYYVEAFMKYGCFGVMVKSELTEDEKKILHRFSIEFERAYTRFLDLQKAEAQTREAQVETGLERVRSRTMAMQQSDELAETAAVMFQQLILLGIAPNRLFIGIINDDSSNIEAWATSEDGSSVEKAFTLSASKNETVNKMFEGWLQQKKSLVIDVQGDELKNYLHYLAEEVQVPFKDGLEQKRRVQTIAYFAKGFIGIASPDDLPAETKLLLERFAGVFNLTFTRFSDLKIAEAHALQAAEDLIKLQTEKKRAEDALTELQATQKQLIQSEKMASLGELTAGIAHEIQNPLNFVNNFSEVSKELLDEMKEEMAKGNMEDANEIMQDIIQNLEKINHHGKRADAIVKGMLQHSSSGSNSKELADINALAEEYLRLAYHGLRAKDKSFNATLKTDYDKSIGNINIIPQDIGRVLLNLYNNAFYAAPLSPEAAAYKHAPNVWVSTKKMDDKVCISVRDNGPGISQKILDKIFQPFFTTKPTGKGTGLGLSLAYDIVKAHGGELKVETKEGEGSEFIILLPVV